MARTKKTKQWVIEEWAKRVIGKGMTLDEFSPSDRRRVEQAMASMQKPVDPKKSICQDLEVAADRVNHVGGCPASSKQCWFIACLLHDKNMTADDLGLGCVNTQAMLTIRKASEIINDLKTL